MDTAFKNQATTKATEATIQLTVIKYAHRRTTEGHERYRQKIYCLIPEVKADSCQHDSI